MISKELQVEIDDMLGCPGHCPGCVISSLDRRAFKSDMPVKTLDRVLSQINSYVKTLELKKLNITYGIADHGLLKTDYLVSLYNKAANIIIDNKLANGRNAVFMTFSLIGKHKNVAHMLDMLFKEANKNEVFGEVPLYPIAVIDPALIYNKSFGAEYLENLDFAISEFEKVDLAINLSSETIQKLSPKELFEFAQQRGFDEVTINLVPTLENAANTLLEQKKMVKWLIEYDQFINRYHHPTSSYRPVLKSVINHSMCKSEDGNTLLEHIDSIYANSIGKSIQFDHLGQVFAKFEAIGDIPHHPRHGLPVMGNVLENSLIDIMKKSSAKTKMLMMKNLSYKQCQSCEFQKACAMTGFHIFNHIINTIDPPKEQAKKLQKIKLADLKKAQLSKIEYIALKPKKDKGLCWHIAQDLFAYYKEQVQKERRDVGK